MPATVIVERIGWTHSTTVLKDRVRDLRPVYLPPDPVSRTTCEPGELAQCDLWFPDAAEALRERRARLHAQRAEVEVEERVLADYDRALGLDLPGLPYLRARSSSSSPPTMAAGWTVPHLPSARVLREAAIHERRQETLEDRLAHTGGVLISVVNNVPLGCTPLAGC